MGLSFMVCFLALHPLRATTALLTSRVSKHVSRIHNLRRYAAPRAKLPGRRVDIFCSKCNQQLFRYAKGNGASSQLIKIYHQRITHDYTNSVYIQCPSCEQNFARETMIHGRRAFKVISGKIRTK